MNNQTKKNTKKSLFHTIRFWVWLILTAFIFIYGIANVNQPAGCGYTESGVRICSDPYPFGTLILHAFLLIIFYLAIVTNVYSLNIGAILVSIPLIIGYSWVTVEVTIKGSKKFYTYIMDE